MRLTILGGGGFRVPLIYQALLEHVAGEGSPGVSAARPGEQADVVLYDLDQQRLSVMADVCAQIAGGARRAPTVRVSTDLSDALRGADVVFCAIRVGGTAGRVLDERVAISRGVLGQETIGAGGLAFALRTIPVAEEIARRIAEVAPGAWTINFTNPAGIITEAMRTHLGDRVIGICDTPLGLARRVRRLLQVPERTPVDYAGLNHLGWLTAVWDGERDLLPDLLADESLLAQLEESQLLGAQQLRRWGAIPNEYVHYYQQALGAGAGGHTRTGAPGAGESGAGEPGAGESGAGESGAGESGAGESGAEPTRGEFLRTQQEAFYSAGAGDGAAARWQRALAEREATYMAHARESERSVQDMADGGYHEVAVRLMAALRGGEPDSMILGVANRGVIPQLPDDAVIEVPCAVGSAVVPQAPRRPPGTEQIDLLVGVKSSERRLIAAARSGSRTEAIDAFTAHPLIAGSALAAELVDAYRRAHPQVQAVLHAP